MTSTKSVVLNDDGATVSADVLEMLLSAVFRDDPMRDIVRNEIDDSVRRAPNVALCCDALRNYALKRVQRDPSLLSTDILRSIVAHKADTESNSSTYPMATRDKPESGFWPIPTDPRNGRSLYAELPYRKRRPLLDKSTPIVSAGSCFAVEIARHFQKGGYNYVITEPETAADGSYKMQYADDNLVSSSAAWGVIFNTPSFRQLAEKAFGVRTLPKILFESRAGLYHDPFREGLEFPSVDAFEANFPRHIEAARTALTKARVLIITLGLNEVWSFKMDGSVFSRSPARIAPSFVEKRVMTVQENVDDLQAMLDLLRKHNPDLELIVTLSPIGLHATFLENEKHVVEANTHSKAVLRVAAEEFVSRNEGVHYFPSYELVMTGIERPWSPDQRHVTDETVSKVMGMFHEMYVRH